VIDRLRREHGFGLVELITTMVILNIAIFALFAMINAGVLSISRASRTSTGAVLAEKQLETYRSLLYQDIGLHASLVSAAGDAIHVSDTAEWNGGTQVLATSCNGSLDRCKPIRTGVVGADNRSYRVDTYVRSVTPASGRPTKRVTVAVRREDDLSANPLAKLTGIFDLSTGCVVGSPTAPC
jgi:type II secretory pathway pseudopilin PulG